MFCTQLMPGLTSGAGGLELVAAESLRVVGGGVDVATPGARVLGLHCAASIFNARSVAAPHQALQLIEVEMGERAAMLASVELVGRRQGERRVQHDRCDGEAAPEPGKATLGEGDEGSSADQVDGIQNDGEAVLN